MKPRHWRTTLLGAFLLIETVCNTGASLVNGQHVSWDDVVAHLTAAVALIKAADAKSV